ncbi:hypothetical protein H9P43_000840 [Blastocladiella emersonii ATCC 22665]|nr:hypothetical protein H9P43_000840 [Blastocladiella emersonii ATCC 22665]
MYTAALRAATLARFTVRPVARPLVARWAAPLAPARRALSTAAAPTVDAVSAATATGTAEPTATTATEDDGDDFLERAGPIALLPVIVSAIPPLLLPVTYFFGTPEIIHSTEVLSAQYYACITAAAGAYSWASLTLSPSSQAVWWRVYASTLPAASAGMMIGPSAYPGDALLNLTITNAIMLFAYARDDNDTQTTTQTGMYVISASFCGLSWLMYQARQRYLDYTTPPEALAVVDAAAAVKAATDDAGSSPATSETVTTENRLLAYLTDDADADADETEVAKQQSEEEGTDSRSAVSASE